MTGPMDRLRAAAARREAAGLRRALRPRTPDHDGLLDLASNDYLGLARHERIVEAAVRATREWGAGSTGSRLVTGSTRLHAELEDRLAAFAGASRALVFSSGYLANLAAVAALGRDGLIVSDAGNHASIVDACRLSRSRVVVTPHGDAEAVAKVLAERDEEHALVVTDAVFSVDGDVAPLRALHEAAVRHGALLVVDEAHALGVVGDHGRGAAHAAGLAGRPDVVRTVTLSKSLGSQGGAVLGAPEVIGTLVDTGRSFIFDTGLAPGCAGAALAALDLLEASPGLPARARERARELAALARGLGLETADPAAAVVPVVLGPPRLALAAAALCADHGVRVGCFRPPSVPQGRACLRLTARADLRSDDLVVVRGALTAVAEMTKGPGRGWDR
ncbi:8-amino-7-oxononanoate synthase [Microbispora triticiradicis]|uniref:8-amino-7-oxononanoate synthase n=1 Tax=Microbispora triticiradicis TaxID=2200763 RepID=UPI001AD693F5|nr:8-amino-7-oxononanoate synthase [Microbispora triticiradicis]MBO4274055.1 aminotransferase class I/II-fold pyridoxal phosphate-dependent enzyme [Microbispora triticiradicis]